MQRKRKIGFILEAILVLTIRSRNAQPGLVVTGIVRDSVTGQLTANAKVSDDGYGTEPYESGVTDSSGRYSYLTWPQEHNIVAEASGYKTQRQILTTSLLRSKKEVTLDFALVRE